MTEISLFYGIRITMNYSEHNPPHFHVEYAGYRASVRILDGVIGPGRVAGQANETCAGVVRNSSGRADAKLGTRPRPKAFEPHQSFDIRGRFRMNTQLDFRDFSPACCRRWRRTIFRCMCISTMVLCGCWMQSRSSSPARFFCAVARYCSVQGHFDRAQRYCGLGS